MARYSFTINNLRTTEEINSYKELIDKGLFQGIEIFYPYRVDKEKAELYTKNIHDLINGRDIEVVLHLPHGGVDNDLCTGNEENIQRFYDAIDYGRQFNATKYTLQSLISSRLVVHLKPCFSIASRSASSLTSRVKS